jgi:hypothetical protein
MRLVSNYIALLKYNKIYDCQQEHCLAYRQRKHVKKMKASNHITICLQCLKKSGLEEGLKW